MNCTCSPLSAFRWAEQKRPSIFRGFDFNYGAAAGGLGHSHTAAQNKRGFEERTGHDLGNVLSGATVRSSRETA